ncbi:circadian clock KaiB family protein [bacterium]|nr:circadian clock KaiB family protein [bacterium]
MDNYVLKLYVTGKTTGSQRAIANLRQICERKLQNSYELVVIDLLEHPQIAKDENILATPTLVRESPQPIERIIGDFSDEKKVLAGLRIHTLTKPERATQAQ